MTPNAPPRSGGLHTNSVPSPTSNARYNSQKRNVNPTGDKSVAAGFDANQKRYQANQAKPNQTNHHNIDSPIMAGPDTPSERHHHSLGFAQHHDGIRRRVAAKSAAAPIAPLLDLFELIHADREPEKELALLRSSQPACGTSQVDRISLARQSGAVVILAF
jgi:hypothetical protein